VGEAGPGRRFGPIGGLKGSTRGLCKRHVMLIAGIAGLDVMGWRETVGRDVIESSYRPPPHPRRRERAGMDMG
jgi:hypothetical protein